MRTLLLVSLVLSLCACSGSGPTQEQLLAQDQSACAQYGFKTGTDGFANCMLQLSTIHAADNRERQARVAAALASFQRHSVTCNTSATATGGFGNSVTGNSTTTCQ